MGRLKIDIAHLNNVGTIEVVVERHHFDGLDPQLDRHVVALSYRAQKDEEGYTVSGDIKGTIVLECARCLKESEYPISIPFHRWYQPETLEIDLEDEFRQLFILDLPVKTVCSEDCKGLCSQCGADLNNGCCSCEKKADEGRWETLRVLLKKKNDINEGGNNAKSKT